MKNILFFVSFCITSIAHANPDLGKPVAPFRIADHLYFVGNTFVASYLIVTKQGNILINSDYATDVPMLKDNIAKLGFKFSDIKLLLINHAHADHAGGSALIKKETGAQYMVMDADVPAIESGGKTDFRYGSSSDQDNFYQPTKVDHVLHDGEKVKLGDAVLTAHKTPGHTPGCTTWTLRASDAGKQYNVVIVGGPFINPGYIFVNNTAYPAIAKDYAHMFAVLKSLPCDIFLGAHGLYYDLERKVALLDKEKANPFIDPEGYKKFVALKEQDYKIEINKQIQSHLTKV